MKDGLHYEVQQPVNREKFVLCHLLAQYFDRLHLQEDRINAGLKKLQNLSTFRTSVKYKISTLFSDLHFYFTTVSGIQRLLLRLNQVEKGTQPFSSIYKKYIKELEKIDSIRDHLEHITDNRIQGKDKSGKPLKDPSSLGNLIDGVYNFGGDTVDLKQTFNLLSGLENEMNSWEVYTFLTRRVISKI